MEKFIFIFSVFSVVSIQFLNSVQSIAVKNAKDENFAWHYLKDYNYISTAKNGNHDMTTGVKMFQEFFHLDVTGELDQATINEMHRPRCGVPDFEDDTTERRKRFVVFGSKWKTNSLTYAFESYTSDLAQPELEQIIAKAFELWANASNLSFNKISDHRIADLKIRFVKGDHQPCSMPFDGPGSVLAHAFFPEIGNLHFDDDELYTDGTNSGTNLLAVATHEIGHLLGIEHSSKQVSVMYSAYTGYDPNFALDQDDVDAIQHIYGGGNKAPKLKPNQNNCRDMASGCKKYKNHCHGQFMRKFCSKTCEVCGGGQAVTQCTNKLGDTSCNYYHSQGFCISNPEWTKENCKKACDASCASG